MYVFNASPDISQKVIADRPAVYIAQAENKEQARQIHRSLWNLGYAPFLIVLLPQQIRVYTGFDYSQKDAQKGLLDEFSLDDIRLLLAEFSSEAIDTGRIWQHGRYKNQLDQRQRVDNRLLQNLRQPRQGTQKSRLVPAGCSWFNWQVRLHSVFMGSGHSHGRMVATSADIQGKCFQPNGHC